MLAKLCRSMAMIAILCLNIQPVKAEFSLFGQPAAPSAEVPFIPVDQAFPFNFTQMGDKLYLDWQVAPGYYLYKDKIKVINNAEVNLGRIEMPAGIPHKDEFFGEVSVYKEPVTVSVALMSVAENASVTVSYQGCAEAGFCYPPETLQVPLTAVIAKAGNTPPSSDSGMSVSTDKADKSDLTDGSNTSTRSQSETATGIEQTDQAPRVSSLADNWWQPLLFLGLGIGLAFTPCVLPMYPILTGIVLGGGRKSHAATFRLSMLYVQGMALTYTLLGLVVASAGLQFQAALQHPYVLTGISVLFIVLAMSMFGLFTLQLPASAQTWLSQLSNQQKGGTSAGVFTMGAISGLVCSPCTTAPLSGALIYVAQSGDLLTGAVTLYALAIGMGLPLIAAAMFGNKLLPKAGNWMEGIKAFFGFILLAVPIFLAERLIPELWSSVLWSVWLLAALGWLYHISRQMKPGRVASVMGIAAIVGLSLSAMNLYQSVVTPGHSLIGEKVDVSFIKVDSQEALDQELAKAKAAGKPVMLDFYADWCVACKEFEKYTFHDPDVARELQKFVLLQADVTANRLQDIQLLTKMDVLGLPTLEFWDAQGNRLTPARLTGFVEAKPFLDHIRQYQLTTR
ncbi:protein-disulfide reductase DsbD [Veronia pacifica]|uniref:Thiol:disulfide interchange protein DsbD n=1 Tax=Veronia pacifica TaxID=1080227 RepID=A0A1C3EC10_9GAMM|nr:protein-disulfide reductase DsbD [Veronia pacifica]ODA30782.1 protein-disulfide reductase DsbD [Veronia pacifica]